LEIFAAKLSYSSVGVHAAIGPVEFTQLTSMGWHMSKAIMGLLCQMLSCGTSVHNPL
jgi:hypothetical protein